MSQKTPYLQSSGEYFHIYNRGVNRENIFFGERNYDFFVKRMEEYFPATGINILAYCLMPNHYHFLLRQDIPELMSTYVGRVCKSYVQAINVQQKRSGHLFEGKYKCKHIDDVSYLLHLSRYIHLNPVVAGLVQKPEQWKYSSYHHYSSKNIPFVSNGNEPFAQSERFIIDTKIILQEFKKQEEYVAFAENYTPPPKKIDQYLFEE